jgi:hypothetical protein
MKTPLLLIHRLARISAGDSNAGFAPVKRRATTGAARATHCARMARRCEHVLRRTRRTFIFCGFSALRNDEARLAAGYRKREV